MAVDKDNMPVNVLQWLIEKDAEYLFDARRPTCILVSQSIYNDFFDDDPVHNGLVVWDMLYVGITMLGINRASAEYYEKNKHKGIGKPKGYNKPNVTEFNIQLIPYNGVVGEKVPMVMSSDKTGGGLLFRRHYRAEELSDQDVVDIITIFPELYERWLAEEVRTATAKNLKLEN